MYKPIAPSLRPNNPLSDPRSTSAGKSPRPKDILALRGTLRSRP
jgi:hypothetical protein